jgi:hypothetical protein
MWILTASEYYLLGIKMSITNYIGSLCIIMFASIAVVVNLVETVKDIKNYLKEKQWI